MSEPYRYSAGWREILVEDRSDGGAFAKITDQRGGGYEGITLPADERQAAAEALAGDDYRVVPNEGPTRGQVMEVLGVSSVDEIIPAIERLKSTANMPDWERALLAGQAAQEEIDQLKRDHDDLEKQLHDAEVQAAQPDRPEPVSHFDVRPGDRVEVEHDGPPSWRWETVADSPADEDGLWLSFHPGGTLLVPYDATVRVLQAAEPEPDAAAVEALREAIKDCRDDELGDHFDEPRLALALAKRNVRVVSTDA